MFSVEIRSHSWDTGEMPWVDHTGRNKINKLVFSKEHCDEYIPGHYPIESFGSLYRNIDDFRQSPLQSLSDWEIRLPSVYCSEEESLQTVDLFYLLESLNEDNGLEFNLTGCEAVLLADGDPVFIGAVDSVAGGAGGTTISISERIGSPEIKKSDFPVVLGCASMLYRPVKIAKNELNRDVIVISEKMLSKRPCFYVYLEKKNVFVEVSIFGDRQEVRFSDGWMTAVIRRTDAELILEHGVGTGDGTFVIQSGQAENIKNILRKLPAGHDAPYDYVVSDEDEDTPEYLQAWSDRLASPDSYSLGRDPSLARYKYSGSAIAEAGDLKKCELQFDLPDSPESLALNAPTSNIDQSPFSAGNPFVFLEASKKPEKEELTDREWESAPRVEWKAAREIDATFAVNLPDSELPGSAYVWYVTVWVRFQFDGSWLKEKIKEVKVKAEVGGVAETKAVSVYRDRNEWLKLSLVCRDDNGWTMPETQKIKLRFFVDGYENSLLPGGATPFSGLLTLGTVKAHRWSHMPLGDAKLYASTELPGASSAEYGNSIIPSIEGLLSAANMGIHENKNGYSAQAIGDLNNIEYGFIASGEAFSLRDKLRELAAESATLIKFAPASRHLLAKSVSMQPGQTVALIPLEAIALENSIYSFKMESSFRDDILNGILVSWGKNAATGKYEHSLSVDSRGVFRDGELLGAQGRILGDDWLPVIGQLGKNSSTGIGITKSMDSKWVMDWAGAELMAYNHLCLNCAPLRKAQVKCVFTALRELEPELDIGDFVCLDLPGYPPKLARTAWAITGWHDDLDKMASTLELLEAWNVPVVLPGGFLLLENGGRILTEAGQNIKLES